VVAEGVVLLGVQHLEQRRRRVAVERVATKLIDLVEHDDAVVRAALFEGLHDEAGHRADVCAPMAADLRLRVHAAERDAVELAVECVSHRAAKGRLANARRSEQAED